MVRDRKMDRQTASQTQAARQAICCANFWVLASFQFDVSQQPSKFEPSLLPCQASGK